MTLETLVSPPLTTAATSFQEAEQVRQAMRPSAMGPRIAAALAIAGHEQQDFARLCRVLDMKYEPGEYCTVLYQLDNLLVTGLLGWSSEQDPLPESTHRIPDLGMVIYAFPDEPSLPMLKTVLDPGAMSLALKSAISEVQSGEARILRCRVEPLRFRPGKRCTLRIDVWIKDRRAELPYKSVLFGKVYHKVDKARSVYTEMQMLFDSTILAEKALVLARPTGMLEDWGIVLQAAVAGKPLDELISCRSGLADRRVVEGVTRAAVALSAVHHSGLTAGRSRSIERELDRFQKRGRKIQSIHPELGERIVSTAERLKSWLGGLEGWGAEDTIVHGDCKPSQFLVSPEGAAILDFDHVGMADPGVDVGTFLATLRQMACKEALRRKNRMNACRSRAMVWEKLFLDQYSAAGPVHENFSQRARWYEAVGLVRKAIRAFERSPYSNLPESLLSEADALIAELPKGDSERAETPQAQDGTG